MKKLFCNVWIILIGMPLIATNTSKQELLEQICNYEGRKTFLLSYPRSGNTWVRYCLEYLTKRSSIHKTNLVISDDPIGWAAGFEIDCAKPPIYKMHNQRVIREQCDYEHDLLILIVRNPKEALSREIKKEITFNLLTRNHGWNRPITYFDNIILYDSWKPENRFLIYYEDLLTKPAEILMNILLFLHEPLDHLDNFMKEYATHKKKSIEIYKKHEGESQTKGNDLLFHSRLISSDHRKQIDEWITELHPFIWQKYLKERYAEENLSY